MNGMFNMSSDNLMKLLAGMTGGDKCFGFTLGSICLLYGLKRIFDSTDKAMDCGYDTAIVVPNCGGIRFTQGEESTEPTSEDEATSIEQDSSENQTEFVTE